MIIRTASGHAVPFARTALAVLDTRYPYSAGHASRDAADTDVTPDRLHPAFHGALDWHSSVHMQWSLVQLLRHDRPALDEAGLSESVTELLDRRLTPEHCAAEAAYLRERPGYERPYGWAWALQLAAATTAAGPVGGPWAAALEPLVEVLSDHVLDWLPRQAHPVRHGVHTNTAFALTLIIDAGQVLGRPDVVAACRRRARDWFEADTDADTRWEPSGTDFLSPVLCESELMALVLPAVEYATWLDQFLPGLGSGRHENLLAIPTVLDETDGHFVHLHGLALSRSHQLHRIAHLRPAEDPGRAVLGRAAAAQLEAALPAVTDGDFMATHWLVSFALRALSGPPPASPTAR